MLHDSGFNILPVISEERRLMKEVSDITDENHSLTDSNASSAHWASTATG